MSENKRYYWLKLDESFFEDDTIAWLEEQENGKDYVIFYLKLALKSLKDDGRLIRYVGETLIPYDVKALAKLTNTSPDTVAVAMKTFLDIGLVSQLESGEIYLNQIEEMVGSETDVAKRVRKHRAKKALGGGEKKELLQGNTDETKSNTEKEKEKEKELEIDKDTMSSSDEHDRIPYLEIVEYLNEKTNSQYRPTSKKTQALIKARYNDGFNIDDFKIVIDNKTMEWYNDVKMSKFLRPETLFGTKFESYLNQKVVNNRTEYNANADIDEELGF